MLAGLTFWLMLLSSLRETSTPTAPSSLIPTVLLTVDSSSELGQCTERSNLYCETGMMLFAKAYNCEYLVDESRSELLVLAFLRVASSLHLDEPTEILAGFQ